MKKLLFTLIILSFATALYGQPAGLKRHLTQHVYTLAADSLMGRAAGSADAMKAAEYIVTNFKSIGISPFVEDTTYLQSFSSGRDTHHNVIGYIEGSDPVLKNEYIVFGAHYDHLGVQKRGNKSVIYNGADDNASGVAALIEIARMLKTQENRLLRSVLFVAFDAEEIGLIGSEHLASTLPHDMVKSMISIDMVGWLRAEGALHISGVGTLQNGSLMMEKLNIPPGLNLNFRKFDTKVMGDSDHGSFAKHLIPNLYITTGTKSPYHKPEDTAEKIDYDGLALVTEYLAGMAVMMASEPILASSGRYSRKHVLPRTEFGLTASVGSNRHHYASGAFTGKQAFAWSGGVFAQHHMGIFALRPELLYQRRTARYPAEDGQAGTSYRKFTTDAITVPISLMLKLPKESPLYIYVNAGGYYSCNLRTLLDGRKFDIGTSDGANRHEAGWIAGFGFSMGHTGFGYTYFGSLTRILKPHSTIKNQSHYFSLFYKF